MDVTSILTIAGLFLGYSLVSGRLRTTAVTAPMIFTFAGMFVTYFFPGLIGVDFDKGIVHLLAELTLIFVLFSDASSINLSSLKNDHILPVRMLSLGLPLTIVAGALTALFIFGEFSIWEAALLAAILAPTDAALGQAVVTERVVPERVRQAISVESGLNDGIVLPVVLIFAGLIGMHSEEQTAAYWTGFILFQTTLGPLCGISVGFLGAKAIDAAVDNGYISGTFEGIAALSVALIAFASAESVGGNGFISAFAAGLVFGSAIRHKCKFLFEFAESEGQFFTLSTFFVFGAVALGLIGENLTVAVIVFAILSLTTNRILPVALSLVGTGVTARTMAFLGWFGPRGLASILFALIVIEEEGMGSGNKIVSVVVVTVLASILLHGMTASFLSRRYGEYADRIGEGGEIKRADESI